MKYWAYINNAVCGPFEKEKLAELPNFSLASMLCPDAEGGGDANAWKAASAFPEVLAVFGPAPAPAQPAGPAAGSPLMMTMRGTLIEEPAGNDQEAKPAPVQPRVPPAESPLMMTMRGTLIDAPLPKEPPASAPARAAAPAPTEPPKEIAGSSASRPEPQPEPVMEKLERMSAMLVSIGNTQSQLLERLGRVESSVADMKALLFPAPPKK